jgi:ATP-dependent DNA helicase RecQ
MPDRSSLDALQAALQHHFGFPAFRPGQREAIQHVLAGRDTLVVMPTGAGKSLCYQLPALLAPGVTLVVSPLIALMKDQVDALMAADQPAAYINSTLSAGEQRQRLFEMAGGAYKLVYVSPERLRNTDFVRAAGRAQIARLAVDEAHCISQWGHDFRPDYLYLRQARSLLSDPPVLALTATATRHVQSDIADKLGLTEPVRIVTGFNRPNLTFAVRYTPDVNTKRRELQTLLAAAPGSAIVYVGRRRDADEVAEFVRQVIGLPAAAYHAGLDKGERASIQEAFMADKLQVVVATNAFGMGVDKPDIRAVIHYALPGTVEAYYQEAGRAGRDEQPAQCVLLYSPEDRSLQEWFIDNDAPNLAEMELLHRVLSNAAQDGLIYASTEDVSRATGLPEVKARVGISELERAGALGRLGDQAGVMVLQVVPLAGINLAQNAAEIEQRRAHKRQQLQQMIHYAEMNACRRRFILDYFGDPAEPHADDCCDNCRVAATPTNRRKATTRAEIIALGILDTVRLMKWEVGRSRLAEVLKGSRARGITQYGYDRHKHYAKLADFTLNQIQHLIDQLVNVGYLKVIGGDRPVLRLTPAGQAALKSRTAIPLALPEISHREARPGRFDTVAHTRELFESGLSPDQIATERGLVLRTIYNHLAQLIGRGELDVDRVVLRQRQVRIRAAISQVGLERLSPIKAALPEEFTYDEIRCVVEAVRRETREKKNVSNRPG